MHPLWNILFYFYSAILIASATAVITVRSRVHAALFLVLCFFTSAIIWILMETEFLAIVLLVVYVGAVMVLFLFVVMMLDGSSEPSPRSSGKYLPVGLLVAGVMTFESVLVLSGSALSSQSYGDLVPRPAEYSNIRDLGELLYTEYLFPFEVASVILLVAIIAALILTLRQRSDRKLNDPSMQVRALRDDHVKMVKMDAEKEKMR